MVLLCAVLLDTAGHYNKPLTEERLKGWHAFYEFQEVFTSGLPYFSGKLIPRFVQVVRSLVDLPAILQLQLFSGQPVLSWLLGEDLFVDTICRVLHLPLLFQAKQYAI